jgi:hypothetical protein
MSFEKKDIDEKLGEIIKGWKEIFEDAIVKFE